MAVDVTMLQTRRGEDGSLWTAGNIYSASEAFAQFLISSNLATGTVPPPERSGEVKWIIPTTGTLTLLRPDNGVAALSEALGTSEHLTATATVSLSELAGWICTVAAGTLTIYYGANTSGQLLLPATNLALGPVPIFGPGHNGRLPIPGGQIHCVLSSGSARVSIVRGI